MLLLVRGGRHKPDEFTRVSGQKDEISGLHHGPECLGFGA